MRSICYMITIVVTAAACDAAQFDYVNDFNVPTLQDSGFLAVGREPSDVRIEAGQLVTETDIILTTPRTYGVASGLLDGTAIPGYPSTLSSAAGTVTWAFNLEYADGSQNSDYHILLACSEADRLSRTSDSYVLVGGGQVGHQMQLSRADDALIRGGAIVLTPNGLPPNEKGAFRIEFHPLLGRWDLYMEYGDSFVDPRSIQTLIGSGVDSVYTSRALPYLFLGATSTGTARYDNLSITVIPEPTLAVAASAILCLAQKRHGIGTQRGRIPGVASSTGPRVCHSFKNC